MYLWYSVVDEKRRYILMMQCVTRVPPSFAESFTLMLARRTLYLAIFGEHNRKSVTAMCVISYIFTTSLRAARLAYGSAALTFEWGRVWHHIPDPFICVWYSTRGLPAFKGTYHKSSIKPPGGLFNFRLSRRLIREKGLIRGGLIQIARRRRKIW